MKILYAIQGTGNGHLSRARDIIPLLLKRAEVDILVSGTQVEVSLPYEIKYRYKGLGFVFGKKGGVDIYKTIKDSDFKKFIKAIKTLPVEDYDLVINDFEPVSAWACHLKNLPCISLSNQSAVINKNAPKPKHIDPVGLTVLKRYAPATAHYGFHFASFDENIYTPIIRKQVRDLNITDEGHYTVYLPAYDDERLVKHLRKIKNVKWEIFSKHNNKPVNYKNISIRPVNNNEFLKSMASSSGVLCGAGFETPSEALFLGKKLLVIPMINQYEQHCNAAALKTLGVPSIKSLKKKHIPAIKDWINNGKVVPVHYPDIIEDIIDEIFEKHINQKSEIKKLKIA